MRINSVVKLLKGISLYKTIRFNLHYFSFSDAIHLPVLVNKNVEFHDLRGGVFLPSSKRFGMVRIGESKVGFFSSKMRTVWDVRGNVFFKGIASLGKGSRICVAKDASVTFGNNFAITANSTIDCVNNISFGNDCLLSWDILIMDSDYHSIIQNGNVVNYSKPISIGNHVWIGNNTTLLKGVNVADDVVFSCGSIVTKSVNCSYCVVSSKGKEIIELKKDITWEL